MQANDRQVGGAHYGGGEYQHWDWIHDCRIPYTPATASKYVDRWRKKNGKQDLEKALHYLEKAREQGYQGSSQMHRASCFWRYVLGRNHTLEDAQILWYIMEGEWEAAVEAITLLYQSV